jgi:hypothetical protein
MGATPLATMMNAVPILSCLAFVPSLALSTGACSLNRDRASNDEDVRAATRTLKFAGVVYVDAGATDEQVVRAVKRQTRSAYGALRTAKISVNTRELSAVDPSTFEKKDVTVVDPDKPDDPGTKMTQINYTYTERGVVPASLRKESAINLAVLGNDYEANADRVLRECTDNSPEAQQNRGSIWYVFNPSTSGCRNAIAAEQKRVEADHARIQGTKVPRSEVDRLYLPMKASLKSTASNPSMVPENDSLYGSCQCE